MSREEKDGLKIIGVMLAVALLILIMVLFCFDSVFDAVRSKVSGDF